jgi:hypothetical protein
MLEPHRNTARSATRRTPEGLDATTRGRIKAARTKRLRRRLAPFEEIDEQVVALVERITPADGEQVGTNVARTILQAQTLRKELLLGKLKAEEVERRLEESDVVAEWERVKRELGIS